MSVNPVTELTGLTKRFDGCRPGVSTVSNSISEYEERDEALGDRGVAEDPVSFMFVFGGHDGDQLLDDMWCRPPDSNTRGRPRSQSARRGSAPSGPTHRVFHFARNPSRIGSEANRPKSLSARFDFKKGPYIAWTQLVTNTSKYHPLPMVHAKMVYLEAATGSPVGNIYIFGGVRLGRREPVSRPAPCSA